ncbi:hypothetical protein ACFSKM_20190 [Ancylobacter dichloromethanicus]
MIVISIRKIRRSWRICLCAVLAGGVLGWSVANFAPGPADFVRALKVMVGWDGAGEAFRRQRLTDITADVSTYDVVMLGDSITEGVHGPTWRSTVGPSPITASRAIRRWMFWRGSM